MGTASQLSLYLDRRIISIFTLGIVSGLPWVMIGSALTLWLKEVGISRTEIGYASLITFVYSINCFWSPLLDAFKPKLPLHMGSRRSWVLLCQCVIGIACLVMSNLSPSQTVNAVVFTAFVIALTSATQDIAIDAYRVDLFERHQNDLISVGASAATAGWWTGYALVGFLPLWLSDLGWSWPLLYLLMGGLSLSFSLILFISPDPPRAQANDLHTRLEASRSFLLHTPYHYKLRIVASFCAPFALGFWALSGAPGLAASAAQSPLFVPIIVFAEVIMLVTLIQQLNLVQQHQMPLANTDGRLVNFPAWLLTVILAPFTEFFQRNGMRLALTLLLFVVIFKLGESFLGRMSILFYKEIGFSNTQIASYSKIMTWLVTILAAIPCGILNAKIGITRGLFISGIFMAASNVLFIVLAYVGPVTEWYMVTAIVDGITQAWSSIAFVSFISMLCSHTFSATQYALLASLGSLGRSTLAAFSGQMVDALDGNWVIFFIITSAMVIPGLVMLLFLSKRLQSLANNKEN